MDHTTSPMTIDAGRLAWRETGEEIVVLDLQESVYFGLNPTAARLWALLVHGATHDDLVAHLVRDQRIDTPRAEADVDEFLGVLKKEGLVRAATG